MVELYFSFSVHIVFIAQGFVFWQQAF